LEHKNTFARWGLGECLRLKGKYEEALQVFDLAASMISVEVIPRRLSTKIFRSRGQTFSRLGRPDEAISAFKNALDLAPPGSTDRVDLIIDLSLASRDREDYIEALSYLREIDPEIIRAQSAKGIIYSDIAEYELSIAILDEVLKRAAMGPSDIKNAQRSINRNTLAKVYHYKGWSLIHLNKAEEAHKVYEEAIRLNTEDLLAHKGIANALRLQNNIIDAENKYRYVVNQVKMKPLNSHLLSILGWCHYCLGEYDKAIRCFNDVYSLNPEWIGNRFDLALALLCSGRYTLGIQEYSMSIKLTESKQVPNQHGLLCLAYYDFKDERDNFKRLDRAIEERNKANDLLNNALKQIIGPYEEIKRSLICP
jgi:tetratricopeptide (TPR) repeat protein